MDSFLIVSKASVGLVAIYSWRPPSPAASARRSARRSRKEPGMISTFLSRPARQMRQSVARLHPMNFAAADIPRRREPTGCSVCGVCVRPSRILSISAWTSGGAWIILSSLSLAGLVDWFRTLGCAHEPRLSMFLFVIRVPFCGEMICPTVRTRDFTKTKKGLVNVSQALDKQDYIKISPDFTYISWLSILTVHFHLPAKITLPLPQYPGKPGA